MTNHDAAMILEGLIILVETNAIRRKVRGFEALPGRMRRETELLAAYRRAVTALRAVTP